MKKQIKSITAVFLVFTMVMGVVPLSGLLPKWMGTEVTVLAAEGGYGSNGKFLAPIEAPVAGSIPISSRAELESISDNLSGSYHLTADIDLSGAEWVPIGDNSTNSNASRFTGIFDGQGYVIKNLTITNDNNDCIGLFGVVSFRGVASFKNVGLTGNISIDGNVSKNNRFIGALAGAISYTNSNSWTKYMAIENCYSYVNIYVNTNDSYCSVGGLTGAYSTSVGSYISNSYNAGNLHANVRATMAGGICGQASDSRIVFEDCFNIGDIYASSSVSNQSNSNMCGGIVGSSSSSKTFIRCYNKGDIKSTYSTTINVNAYAGGIVGYHSDINADNQSISIEDCYNTGKVSAASSSVPSTSNGTAAAYAGGLAGYISFAGRSAITSVKNCYISGDVEATAFSAINKPSEPVHSSAYCGGVFGYADRGVHTVENCVVSSNILAADANSVYCNVVGYCHDDDDPIYAGGPISYWYSIKTNNYVVNDLTGDFNNDADSILSRTKLYEQSTYSNIGWDFNTVWKMPVDGGYPILQGRYKGGRDDEANDNLLKIVRFDWSSPSAMNSNGTATKNNIHTYVFDTYVYAHKLYLTVTEGAEWALFEDAECTEPVDKTATQTYAQLGTPYMLYIKLTKVGFDDVVYGLEITRLTMPLTDTPTTAAKILYESPHENGGTNTVGVEWGASLFKKDATEYNPELALVAAALSAAADTENGNPQFLRGTQSIDGAYFLLGLANEKYYNYSGGTLLSDSKEGEHCFSIASQEMIINGEEHNVIVVVLRGTKNNGEWFFGSETWGDTFNNAEKSFYEYTAWNYQYYYAEKVEREFWKYINDNDLWDNDIKVLITGHSLGGAAANLFAASFALNGQKTVDTNDVYAFTFGALNSITSTVQHEKFNYINNVFNYYDTYGPIGKGTAGVRPSDGWKTMTYKFGHILEFIEDYREVFNTENKYVNHNMPAYVDALRRNLESVGADSTRLVFLCPVDVEVYDNSNQLVARIENNIVDTSVTKVPAFVEDDEKYILLPTVGQYEIRISAFGTGVMSYIVETANSSTNASSQIKLFENIALISGKQMLSEVGSNIYIPDTRLYVLNEVGEPTKEVHTDGTEVSIASKSDDAALAGLSVSVGTLSPLFNPNTMSYSVVVGNNTSSISVAATKNHTGATVAGGGTHVLAVGANQIQIIVTAENGATKIYNIVVNRATGDSGSNGSGNSGANSNGNTGGSNLTGGGDIGSTTPSSSSKPTETGEVPPPAPALTPWNNPFGDVSPLDWFYDDVRFVAENNIMIGTAAGVFSPRSTVTRAMLATILYKLEAAPVYHWSSNTFIDVSNDQWYTGAAIWASSQGVMVGYGNGVFGSNDVATREQIVAVLYNYVVYKGMDVSTQADLANYTDSGQISAWSLPAMKWAVANGIVNGRTVTTLAPRGEATRAEIAAILRRLMLSAGAGF